MNSTTLSDRQYAHAMGRLLVLYTQVDQFIMEACADRIGRAPDQEARMGLAKQVGDECRHVAIQTRWMEQFGVPAQPVLPPAALDALHRHFRSLEWVDFLIDLYLVIEALGSQAVEQIVPLADPGTRASLQVPLRDELDHVAFGVGQLQAALKQLEPAQRCKVLDGVPQRIDAMLARLSALEVPLMEWFEAVGSDPLRLRDALQRRKSELLDSLALAA